MFRLPSRSRSSQTAEFENALANPPHLEEEDVKHRLKLSNYLYIFRRFWGFLKPYRGKFFLGICLMLLAVPMSQFALFLTRDVTNKALLATDKTVDERWSIVLGIIGLQAAFWFVGSVLNTFKEVMEWYVSMRSTFDLRLKFYNHLQRLPLAFLRQRPPGEHLYRATTDIAWTPLNTNPNDGDGYQPGLMGMIGRQVPLLITTIYSVGWGAALLYLIDSTLMWMLLAYIVPYTIAAHFMYDKLRRTSFALRAKTEDETAVLRDSVVGLRTVKSTGRGKCQRRRYIGWAVRTRRENIRFLFETVLTDQIVLFGLKWIFNSILFTYITYRVMSGQATIGDWMATLLLVAAAQIPLEKIVQIVQTIRIQMVPAQRVLETLDVLPVQRDLPGAQPIGAIAGGVSFNDVTFEYILGKPALDGISLEIKPGERVGFVGPSGAGKSSILALLLRLYIPNQGQVLVDGIDTKLIQLDSLLDQCAVVPQSTYLYDGTIGDNILFGNKQATNEELQSAAVQSGVDAFVRQHPDGYDTVVGEGATISGGERQRIGIARALIRDPKILILDEATANLDPITEDEILETIDKISDGRTVIAVAHRLKAVARFDRIVVMENGKIVDSGTHRELLKRCKLYESLWREQNPRLDDLVGERDG